VENERKKGYKQKTEENKKLGDGLHRPMVEAYEIHVK
jgi:hypothetical protein